MSANRLNIPTEAVEQQKLVQWLRLKKIFHYATTNENNSFMQNRKYAMIAEQKAKDFSVSKIVFFFWKMSGNENSFYPFFFEKKKEKRIRC